MGHIFTTTVISYDPAVTLMFKDISVASSYVLNVHFSFGVPYSV